jgi:TnpA family transposase
MTPKSDRDDPADLLKQSVSNHLGAAVRIWRDLLMHNDVVQSDIHSTDAFGYSEAIFASSYLLGFSYAPRFKNLKRQRLYIFKNRQKDDSSTWQIKCRPVLKS